MYVYIYIHIYMYLFIHTNNGDLEMKQYPNPIFSHPFYIGDLSWKSWEWTVATG